MPKIKQSSVSFAMKAIAPFMEKEPVKEMYMEWVLRNENAIKQREEDIRLIQEKYRKMAEAEIEQLDSANDVVIELVDVKEEALKDCNVPAFLIKICKGVFIA